MTGEGSTNVDGRGMFLDFRGHYAAVSTSEFNLNGIKGRSRHKTPERLCLGATTIVALVTQLAPLALSMARR